MSTIDFWKIKHQIDDEIKRLGWSTSECKAYIQKHYNKHSRLVMNDYQLQDLFCRLWYLGRDDELKVSKPRSVRRRRRNKN